MLLTLLLQTNVPYAIYATLTVGVLSLIASGLNIYFSSKTAQKVVNLSTKTTREVAELSAQVSRESAGLAAQTARELKDKDYKNDFNKKILEKRLNAWADAEQFVLPSSSIINKMGDKERFNFFYNQDDFHKILNTLNKHLMSQIFWLGGGYALALINFRNKLTSIRSSALSTGKKNSDGSDYLNPDKLLEAGAAEHKELFNLYNKMLNELTLLISNLYDIESFLEKKKRGI